MAEAEAPRGADSLVGDAPRSCVVVGLGNPGSEYDGTRHNLGFAVLDEVARRASLTFQRITAAEAGVRTRSGDLTDVASGRLATGEGAGAAELPFFLIRPRTYMNLSGEVFEALDPARSWDPAGILAVYDDLDLPVGRLRVRARGSGGGHRGVQSLIDSLRTSHFPRLRLGIGSAGPDQEAVDWVLDRPAGEEREVLSSVVAEAARGVLFWLDSASTAPNFGAATESLMHELNVWSAPEIDADLGGQPEAGDPGSPRSDDDPDGSLSG